MGRESRLVMIVVTWYDDNDCNTCDDECGQNHHNDQGKITYM